jgi:hypothetical protein
MSDEAAEYQTHCDQVARAILDGRVVPLLGAGANLCGRTATFAPGNGVLPDGRELASHLTTHFGFREQPGDLVRTAQYVVAKLGEQPLYDALHGLFDADYGPTTLHRFLARVPEFVSKLPMPPRERHQLIVTTNYDDALETAMRDEGVAFDLVSYICSGDDRGHLLHRRPDGTSTVVEVANEYQEIDLDERPVILKIHGAVDRRDPDNDSYVITEDDYIDYLTRTEVSQLLPPAIIKTLRRSHMLFLGYSLTDWNLRAIFHSIWEGSPRKSTWWAIQMNPDDIDRVFWKGRGVEIYDRDLRLYVEEVEAVLGRLTNGGPR